MGARPIASGGVVLAALAALAIAPGNAGAAAKCTIKGTPNADTLTGTRHKDVICGRGGDDVIRAAGGGDLVLGGGGGDELHGEAGADRIGGGRGDDTVDGGPGRNICAEGELPDVGGACVDYLIIEQLRVSPEKVDTSRGPRVVEVTARIADTRADSPGIHTVVLLVESQRDGRPTRAEEVTFELVAGTDHDGTWSGSLTLPARTPTGTYGMGFYVVYGPVPPHPFGDSDQVSGAALHRAGLPNTIEQLGPGDTERPRVEDVSISPISVDTSTGPAEVTFTVTTHDDDSGVQSVFGQLEDPRSQRNRSLFFASSGGGETAKRWTARLPLARWSATGRWKLISLEMVDRVGFFRNYGEDELTALGTSSFHQTGEDDEVPPVLEKFTLSKTKYGSGEGPPQYRVEATDDRSGAFEFEYNALDDGGQPVKPGYQVSFPGYGSAPEHAIFTGAFDLRAFGEPPPPEGTYAIRLLIRDGIGNERTYDAPELEALGFPGRITYGP